MTDAPNHYEVLGIPETASVSEIKAAYRQLAFKFHPDRNATDEASGQFYAVTHAYEALIDPLRRASYDRLQEMRRARAQAPSPSQPVDPARRAQDMRAAPTSKFEPEPPQTRTTITTKPSAEEIVRLTGLLTRGRIAEAERMARRMISVNVQHPIPYAVMGDIARMKGELGYAVEMYAHAVQHDSRNLVYQRKHEESAAMLGRGERRIPTASEESPNDSATMLVAMFGVLLLSGYLVMTNERPVTDEVPLISTWTWSLFGCLGISGGLIGGAMSLAGLLQRFGSSMGASSTRSVAIAPLISLIAIFNLWAAMVIYGLYTGLSRLHDLNATRLLTAVGLITLVLTGACAAQGTIDPLQTLAWGGSVVHAGTIIGWLLADAYLEESGRLK